MPRPRKDAVDYFPHFVNWGKTIPILESRYGNDGYAAWFKILEVLGKTAGHALDCNDSMEWEFLVQKLRVTEEVALEIIDLLCKLDAVDPELWRTRRIIWSSNYIRQLERVYAKRGVSVPEKPDSSSFCAGNSGKADVSETEMRQSIVENSIVENSIVPDALSRIRGFLDSWNEWQSYRKEIKKKLTKTAIAKQLKFLAKQPDPVACIDQSIRNGWQGLFEIKKLGNQDTIYKKDLGA